MQKLASEICPTGSVFWPGMVTGKAKWGALYHCDAFVLPSNQENFGIAIVEALACGRPVLISNQVNIWREVREAGVALVEENSVAGTTRLLSEWSSLSPATKSNMAANALPCFQSQFSLEAVTENLLKVVSPHEETRMITNKDL
jgi:glycosyltransferase involved in cell wall biosynthesis